MTTHLSRAVRFGALLALAALLMAFVAACGSGDDDSTSSATNTPGGATATAATGGSTTATAGSGGSATTPTTGAGAASATPGSGSAATATSPSASEATATTASEPEATATTATSEEPTATSESEEATATTGDASETPTATDDPIEDYQPLDPDQLPNFTLTAQYDFEGTSADEDSSSGTFAMDIEQSAVDNYHTKIDTGDPTELIETWADNGTVWVSYGGEVTEIPEGTDTSTFSPTSFLNQVPDIADKLAPQKVGEDNISGRKTTHYKATAEQFLDLMSSGSEDDYLKGATNEEGNVEIWIDNDLKIIMKLDVDVTWTNADGTPGKATETYLISDIGSTARVEPPQ